MRKGTVVKLVFVRRLQVAQQADGELGELADPAVDLDRARWRSKRSG
jgi:hypothetical protein